METSFNVFGMKDGVWQSKEVVLYDGKFGRDTVATYFGILPIGLEVSDRLDHDPVAAEKIVTKLPSWENGMSLSRYSPEDRIVVSGPPATQGPAHPEAPEALLPAVLLKLDRISEGLHHVRRPPSIQISCGSSTAWVDVCTAEQVVARPWTSYVSVVGPSKKDEDVPEFVWSAVNENQQRAEYSAHIESIIRVPDDVEWVDASALSDLLKVSTSAGALHGTSDYIAVDKEAVLNLDPGDGLRLLFELKKVVDSSKYVRQAYFQVLAANLRASYNRPVVVLTDLRNQWHFYWMDGKTLWHYCAQGRGHAIAIAEQVLRRSSPISTPNLSPSDSNLKRPREECGTPRGIWQRREFQLPTMDTSGDAPLADLRGFLSAREYNEMIANQAMQLLMQIPSAALHASPPLGMYS